MHSNIFKALLVIITTISMILSMNAPYILAIVPLITGSLYLVHEFIISSANSLSEKLQVKEELSSLLDLKFNAFSTDVSDRLVKLEDDIRLVRLASGVKTTKIQ